MSGDFLHPLVRECFDRAFRLPATTEPTCPTCGGTARLADAPCPRCCCPSCGKSHPTLESWEREHGRAF